MQLSREKIIGEFETKVGIKKGNGEENEKLIIQGFTKKTMRYNVLIDVDPGFIPLCGKDYEKLKKVEGGYRCPSCELFITEGEREEALRQAMSQVSVVVEVEETNCLKVAAWIVFYVVCSAGLLMGLYTEVLGAKEYLLLSFALLGMKLVEEHVIPIWDCKMMYSVDTTSPALVGMIKGLVLSFSWLRVAWFTTGLGVGVYGLFNDNNSLVDVLIYLVSTIGFGGGLLFIVLTDKEKEEDELTDAE